MLKPDTRTPTIALVVLLSTLVACKMFKKKEEELPPVPDVSAVTPPVAEKVPEPPPKEDPASDQPKLGDVKRFKDKEKEAEGVVKVLEAEVKVFNEPDNKTPHVAELNKNIFVSRLATLDDFVLVEFPSGVGELSPGWVETKFLSEPDTKVSEEKVKSQQAAKIVSAKTEEKAADDKAEETKETDKKAEETKEDDKKAEETKEDDKKAEEEKKPALPTVTRQKRR